MSDREQFEAWAIPFFQHGFPAAKTPSKVDIAWEAWKAARTQPAQVLQGQCGECGKKASEGWALYCVACMEVAGLPGGTDKPADDAPKHTSLVRTPDFTAQVPTLTEAEIDDLQRENNAAYHRGDVTPRRFARAIEAALIAKMGGK